MVEIYLLLKRDQISVLTNIGERLTDNGDEDVEPFEFKKAEEDARKDELELLDDWFENLKDMERIEWMGIYINSFTTVFDPHTEYMAPQRQEDFEEQECPCKIININFANLNKNN